MNTLTKRLKNPSPVAVVVGLAALGVGGYLLYEAAEARREPKRKGNECWDETDASQLTISTPTTAQEAAAYGWIAWNRKHTTDEMGGAIGIPRGAQDKNEAIGLGYGAWRPNCPSKLDPNNPDHAQCIQDWIAVEAALERLMSSTTDLVVGGQQDLLLPRKSPAVIKIKSLHRYPKGSSVGVSGGEFLWATDENVVMWIGLPAPCNYGWQREGYNIEVPTT